MIHRPGPRPASRTSPAPANSPSTTSPIGVDDALGTEVDPAYLECPVDGPSHDTMADASTFRVATGREPEIDFAEGVARVRAPSREADAPGTNETGRDNVESGADLTPFGVSSRSSTPRVVRLREPR
ncbi:hypothetical protein [Halorubrum sp. 48-1-W]|uniref:hypothetical protein n=1 Tax=Halorubrum sp. 48-1-W TaxID=2249761 RepID=UPI000FCB89A7